MNQLVIIGNLTKDPELRQTQDGISVCGFTVAVNRPKTKSNQEPGADFFNVSAWRGLGENCAKYLAKGRKVCVSGRVSLRTWDTGEKHGASMEVLADEVEFLSGKADGAQDAAPDQQHRVDPQSGFQQTEADDLPF